MKDDTRYLIEIRGGVDEVDLNVSSPVHLSVIEHGDGRTILAVETDQSGLIGVIRHLHNLGLILLAMVNPEDSSIDPAGLARFEE